LIHDPIHKAYNVNLSYRLSSAFICEIGEAANLLDSYVNEAFDGVGRLTMHCGALHKEESL
jgi:hypothetical protein